MRTRIPVSCCGAKRLYYDNLAQGGGGSRRLDNQTIK